MWEKQITKFYICIPHSCLDRTWRWTLSSRSSIESNTICASSLIASTSFATSTKRKRFRCLESLSLRPSDRMDVIDVDRLSIYTMVTRYISSFSPIHNFTQFSTPLIVIPSSISCLSKIVSGHVHPNVFCTKLFMLIDLFWNDIGCLCPDT